MINKYMKAYTYTIQHLLTNKIYYGVRKSTVIDIGTTYFSSSKLVKQMLQEEPIENFKFKVRKKFQSYEEARLHETRLLSRIQAVTNPIMLNQAVSSPRLCAKNPTAEIQRRESISKAMKQLWNNPAYKDAQSFNKLSSEERSTRGKAGALKRAENYASGKTLRKPKTPKSYKDVVLVKDGVLKTVKANQVPAYAKSGWSRPL
jgi:hypothetical protein